MSWSRLACLIGLAALLAGAASAAGCGDDDDTDAGTDAGSDTDTDADTDTDTDTGPGPDLVTATVTVPGDFEAVPELIVAQFHQLYPPAGEPVATGDSFADPEIGAGTPYELVTGHAGLEGAYYLWVILYVEGGGAGGDPVLGVDYMGGSPMVLNLGPGTGTTDVGTVALDIYL